MTDLLIYGGTAAGIAAAIQAVRMGKSVVLIEPGNRIGGLTTGGLGQTDIGNKAAIGGLAREFYRRIKLYYDHPSSWRWQKRDEYRSHGQSKTESDEDTLWTFEPSAALRVLQEMVAEANIPVVYHERLDRLSGAELDGPRIVRIRMESGDTYQARMYIDATYEGDLMAAAGVSYFIGREAETLYGETLNGIRVLQAKSHQLRPSVSGYRTQNDPKSGLLPGIDPTGPGEEGAGDRRLQAYGFRMCLTDHPDNRIPFHQPDGYHELDYELLFRNFEAGEDLIPWINSPMPNRKTDTNNCLGFSTDFIGQNYRYPEAGYEERERIFQQHLLYQQGLMWTLANHPRVPGHIREEVGRWGLCTDEFVDSGGWQQQLYIREARRMIGSYVMTQANCQARVLAEDPVGLAAYGMDSHHVQRYVGKDGYVHNEGDVQVGGFVPYPISFRSILPCQDECDNLLVPVCLSASHIAFGSIRMEPVFMVLGQSAATAAALAVDANSAIQEIDYGKLRSRLQADQQRLFWN